MDSVLSLDMNISPVMELYLLRRSYCTYRLLGHVMDVGASETRVIY